MLKLLVIEDHELVREGLARFLRQIGDDVEVGEAPDFESALDLLDQRPDYDLVLLDLALPGIDGFAGLGILRKHFPSLPVAVISAYNDLPTITRVMNGGASGFIPKSFSGNDLLSAVREVLAGNIFRPGDLQPARIDDTVPTPPQSRSVRPSEIGLSERQAQVLSLMVKGLSNRDIAEHLSVSEGAVKNQATTVFKTLGVTSRTQALVMVARYGIDFEESF